jgi:hypothetical protein
MINDNDNEYERALIFFNRKILIHVSTIDNMFYNGQIMELSKTFFILNDQFQGEKFILFNELKKPLEPYTEKTEVKQ